VDPVVVIPDVDSKNASIKFKFRFENKKGNDPKSEIEIQALLVRRKACLNSRCSGLFSLEDRYSPAPTNKVMNDDTKNAAQSSSPRM
jgi:hypothetical protein